MEKSSKDYQEISRFDVGSKSHIAIQSELRAQEFFYVCFNFVNWFISTLKSERALAGMLLIRHSFIVTATGE